MFTTLSLSFHSLALSLQNVTLNGFPCEGSPCNNWDDAVYSWCWTDKSYKQWDFCCADSCAEKSGGWQCSAVTTSWNKYSELKARSLIVNNIVDRVGNRPTNSYLRRVFPARICTAGEKGSRHWFASVSGLVLLHIPSSNANAYFLIL